MGYAVLHIDKARSNDSGNTAHIARTYTPSNVDPSRTHLNRELVQFPVNVTNRSEAIEHRIATAGIYRKVAKNQVKALRFILSSSPKDMARIEQEGRLYEWCDESMDWLRSTFGADNVVAATLHADEETPHIHAIVVPIVTGERRKAKEEAELDKAEKRIVDLEQEAERKQYLSEKEKNEIRKEVVLLQDTVKGWDRSIAELKETVQVYEEERNWIRCFFSGFYQLLNIRLMLRKMNFSDDRIAEMYRTEAPQRGMTKA